MQIQKKCFNKLMENFSKYLCIFGGGAVRGYAYLGALQAFSEVGFYPQKLAGSSVGAVFATLYALDIPISEMEKIFSAVNFELFRDINLKLAPAFSISKGGVFLEWLKENIEKAYYGDLYQKGGNAPVLFKDFKRDLIIITTDLKNNVPFVFSKQTTPNYEVAMAVRASASMPGLLTPVQYENHLLADGDMMKSNPQWRLDKELCPDDLRILELRLEGTRDGKITNMLEYLNTVYSCMTNCSTDFIMDIYSKYDKFDYIKIDTKDLLIVNFNINQDKRNKLKQIGYDSTMKFFKEELPMKKKILLNEYEALRNKLQKMEEFIKQNNIKSAKEALDAMFVILADIKRYIEPGIHRKIKNFRNLFVEKMSYGLFGIEKLSDKKSVKKELLKLKEILDEKCIELSK